MEVIRRAFACAGSSELRGNDETKGGSLGRARRLHGKSVLIAGAGKSIGKSIVTEMGLEGATVFFTDLEATNCRNVEEETIKRCGVHPHWFISNLSKPADNAALTEYFQQRQIPVDILVLNASLGLREIEPVFDTNVLGGLDLARRISELMISFRRGGAIIVLSSVHQKILLRNPSYSASKSALRMVIRELAVELGPHGIRVNGIAPGTVAEDHDGRPRPHRFTPLHRRSILPRFIARGAVYLADDYYSRYTTGIVLTIDSGLSLWGYKNVGERNMSLM